MKFLIELSKISTENRITLARETEDIQLLEALAVDSSNDVKIAVARNTKTSIVILNALMLDKNDLVAKTAFCTWRKKAIK